MTVKLHTPLLILCGIALSATAQQPVQQRVVSPAKKTVTPIHKTNNPKETVLPANNGKVAPAAKGVIVLKWGNPVTEKFAPDAPEIKFMNFKGALYDARVHSLPKYFQNVPLNTGTNHVTVSLVNPVYEPLTAEEAVIVKNSAAIIGEDVNPECPVVLEHKQPYAYLSFIPIRRNSGTGQYEKLVSFSLSIKQSTVANERRAKRHSATFAAHSVLATGKWYKIGVKADGVYKLDYTYFKNMGYDMSKLIPKNIRIYGNGGHMLPDSNKSPRIDDLAENAIYVYGQNDAVFAKNDYVLFYGQGPTQWTYDTIGKHYNHQVNLYSDTTFYFVTADLGPGKRITAEPLYSGTVKDTVTAFDDYVYHEGDYVNLIQSGYEWFGEAFDATTSYNFAFNFPNIISTVPVYVKAYIASRYFSGNSYYTINGPSGTSTFGAPPVPNCYYCAYASGGSGSLSFTTSNPTINITISKQTAGAVGWLYYVELNARRQLTFSNGQMEFRDANSVGAGNTSLFKINSSASNLRIWDITNPQNVDSISLASAGPGIYQYALHTDSLRQFIAFSGNVSDSAIYLGSVANQDLHSYPQADLVIITNPMFLAQANQLASFHSSHDSLKVNVVSIQQVYNEFSSGRQDPIAIRDFMRMFYTRATNYATTPKYLLLFGDGSFDPKSRTANNTNYVLTYESPESFDPTQSYVSDDYYALLDSTEGPLAGGYTLDIGVGRFPVDNVGQAQIVVNKVISYETPSGEPAMVSTSCCNPQAQYNLGNWRNVICFIAHDGDGGTHESEADDEAEYVRSYYPDFNINKIYCDAYQEVQTPGGPRYPDVNTAIDNQMNQGLLIINYTGHGGPLGLAAQRILGFDDIYSWRNLNKLSLFFTASCEFARFDDPTQISAGELCVNLSTGGNIALMTTVRDVYSLGNTALNDAFYANLYHRLPDGTLPRLGDLFITSKNSSGPTLNSIMFTLMGDPAVRLAYPAERIYTKTVNSKSVIGFTDTLKALSKVTITGYVGDTTGNPLSSFNGVIYPIIYDKPDSLVTLDNGGAPAGNIVFPYTLQKNILFRGRASVVNGNFSFSFVMPKDINYKYGFGKLSYYAQNGTIDATGSNQNIRMGGSSNAPNNGKGPQVRLYMNDSNFAFGGMTNENPQLFAIVTDTNGINTTGNGIGHDITAVLDNNTKSTLDLTSYYQPALNSYQKGTITYPFNSLAAGKHSLTLRVWNVFNNSTQSYTEFTVQPQANLQLNHVLNYPNPFTTHTQFFFEINEVCDMMDVQIQIFTVAGKLVKNILTTVKTDSYRSQPIDWDGRDDFGDKIANGVYIYHIKVRTNEGTVADTYQKLVIL